MIAQALEGFALATGLLKDFLLLVTQILPAQEIAFGILPLQSQGSLPGKSKTQLGRGGAHSEFLSLAELHLPYSLVELLDHTTRPRHLLVGRAQAQLLLVLDALPKMKDRLQRKMKSHGVAYKTCSLKKLIFGSVDSLIKS
jgi:hypothetical protein